MRPSKLCALALCALAACAKPSMFEPGTAMTPSEHLAPPERVSEKAKHYVLWVKAIDDQGEPRNAGVLELDRDDQDGELEVKTPLQQFDLAITPEADPTVARPTGTAILSTTIR